MTERTCAINDCPSAARRRGWCGMHYQRWWKHGDPVYTPDQFERCTVDGCAKPPRSRIAVMCEMHYYRVRRNGHTDAPPQPEVLVCVANGCQARARTRGMCGKHAERVRRHGDPAVVLYQVGDSGPLHPSWRGPEVTYSAAHARVRAQRGAARVHQCTDCDATAEHWSYDHAAPDERHSPIGPYSADPMHYQPRCVPCHKRFDAGRSPTDGRAVARKHSR